MLQSDLSCYYRIELYYGSSYKDLRGYIAELPPSVWRNKTRDELFAYIRSQRPWDEKLILKASYSNVNGKLKGRGGTLNWASVPIGECPDGFSLRDRNLDLTMQSQIDKEVERRLREKGKAEPEEEKDFFSLVMEGAGKILDMAQGGVNNFSKKQSIADMPTNNGSQTQAQAEVQTELTIIRTASVMLGIPYDWLLLNCSVDWTKTDAAKLIKRVKDNADLIGVVFK